MKKILALGIITASLPAFAGSYTSEINAGFASGDAETGDITNDIAAWRAGGSYYLSKVNADKGPLREAAFLSKATDFHALLGRTSIEGDTGQEDADFDDMEFGVHLVGPKDLIIEMDFVRSEEDDLNAKSEAISLGAGTYLNDHHAIVISYGVELAQVDDVEDNIETLGVQYHGVQPLQGDAALSYDANVDYIDVDYDVGYDEDGIGFGAGITWYPLRALGIGASLAQTDIGDVTTTSYAIDAEYFINENIAASLAYSVSEEDDDNAEDTVDTNLIAVGVTARF